MSYHPVRCQWLNAVGCYMSRLTDPTRGVPPRSLRSTDASSICPARIPGRHSGGRHRDGRSAGSAVVRRNRPEALDQRSRPHSGRAPVAGAARRQHRPVHADRPAKPTGQRRPTASGQPGDTVQAQRAFQGRDPRGSAVLYGRRLRQPVRIRAGLLPPVLDHGLCEHAVHPHRLRRAQRLQRGTDGHRGQRLPERLDQLPR